MKTRLLTVLMCLACAMQAWAFEVGGISYKTINDTEVEVGSNNYEGNIIIPPFVTYEGKTYNVTAIGEYAFDYCSDLISVTIPAGVKSIENRAFEGCPSLISVTIPNSVKSIGEYAFAWSTSLTSINIPNGVTHIKEGTFDDCKSLLSITIPASVTDIDNHAFYGCNSLKTINLPSSVMNVGIFVFQGNSLESITVDSDNLSFSSLDGVLYNKDQTSLVYYPSGKKGEYTFPKTVTSIEIAAFMGNQFIKEIVIPQTITNIKLAGMTGFFSLTSIKVDSNNPAYSSSNGVLFNKDQTTLISYPAGKAGGYVMPNSVADIDYLAFYSCNLLSSITIPNSVINIKDQAFDGCSMLTKIVIPNSVEEIGYHAFSRCSSLASVTISNKVTNIENFTFSDCTSLRSVIIPEGVTRIGVGVFEECTSLVSVVIPSSVTEINHYAFENCTSLKHMQVSWNTPLDIDSYTVFYNTPLQGCTLYVPAGTKAFYEKAGGWGDFGTIIEGTITSIDTPKENSNIYISGNTLYVNTPVAETISVYSIKGELLYTFAKAAGETSFPLGHDSNEILIIRDSAGKTKKVIQ